MIKFNLLGNKTAIDYRGKYLLVVYITVGFFIALQLGSSYVAYTRQISTLDLQSKTLETELNILKKDTKSVKELEEKRNGLNKKLGIVAKLRRSRSGVVRLLDDFNMAIPSRVWITNFLESGQNVTISGKALENQDVAQFMKRLEKSDYFLSVDLVESKQSTLTQGQGRAGAAADNKGNAPSKKTDTGAVVIEEPEDSNVPIDVKEFTLKARITYLGKLRMGDFKSTPES